MIEPGQEMRYQYRIAATDPNQADAIPVMVTRRKHWPGSDPEYITIDMAKPGGDKSTRIDWLADGTMLVNGKPWVSEDDDA
jgi:hypothetical protein